VSISSGQAQRRYVDSSTCLGTRLPPRDENYTLDRDPLSNSEVWLYLVYVSPFSAFVQMDEDMHVGLFNISVIMKGFKPSLLPSRIMQLE
jgi:hypothetical protein